MEIYSDLLLHFVLGQSYPPCRPSLLHIVHLHSIRGGNSKSLEVKSEGIRVLHNCRPSVATNSFRYLRRIPLLGIFCCLLPRSFCNRPIDAINRNVDSQMLDPVDPM